MLCPTAVFYAPVVFPTAVLLLPVVKPVQLFLKRIDSSGNFCVGATKNIIFLLTHLAMIAIYNR
jgi:hypothetical protein